MLQRRASLNPAVVWCQLPPPLVTSTYRYLRLCVTVALLQRQLLAATPQSGHLAINTGRPHLALPWPRSDVTSPSRPARPETAVDFRVGTSMMTSVGASCRMWSPCVRRAPRHATASAAPDCRRSPPTPSVSLMSKWRNTDVTHSDNDDDDDWATYVYESRVYFYNVIMWTVWLYVWIDRELCGPNS